MVKFSFELSPYNIIMLFFILIVFIEVSLDFKRVIQMEGIDLTNDFQSKMFPVDSRFWIH